jgi:hypothetical protein
MKVIYQLYLWKKGHFRVDGMGWYGLDRSDSGYGPVEGSCERDNKPSGSIKRWEVLEWLHNWQLVKKGSTP